MNNSPISKGRRVAGNVLIYLCGAVLIFSSSLKFVHPPAVLAQMNGWGFDSNGVTLIGVIELLCALMFLIPSTRSIGVLLVSAYFGGAIATHLEHGQIPQMFSPTLILFLICLGSWLRHPAILWSLGPDRSSTMPSVGRVTTAGSV
ncbi:MAG TPA: DoxX family protein [Blastocatellia bacterium]|nr:DoxX family protein [Blastocatellia bacterium]